MDDPTPARIRREPPRFRRVRVVRLVPVTSRLTRVVLGGEELVGFDPPGPASSVRLLLPEPGETLAFPHWNGNEFLRSDGERPTIRTFTPRRFDPEGSELDLEIVLHDRGAASDWVRQATPGDEVAVSGPGRGYSVDPDAERMLIAGDETAIPAICTLLEVIGREVEVSVIVEVADPSALPDLPSHPRAVVEWVPGSDRPGDALADAVVSRPIREGTWVWAAGEAAAVQRIRRDLFGTRGFERRRASIRGYWKLGRGAGGPDAS
jgi:NADPH-dependent ferric siderophore reductase